MTKYKLACNFEAPFFGAAYPDGKCIDGYMWDSDSCDEPGSGLTGGGDIACPHCNTKEYLEYYDFRPSGNSKQRRVAMRKKIAKVRIWTEKWSR